MFLALETAKLAVKYKQNINGHSDFLALKNSQMLIVLFISVTETHPHQKCEFNFFFVCFNFCCWEAWPASPYLLPQLCLPGPLMGGFSSLGDGTGEVLCSGGLAADGEV